MRTNTGIEGLDMMLNGGLPRGRIVLVSGSTGTGKTTLGMQFIYNGVKQFNEPGVYMTFEQDKEKIKADMSLLGMNLDELGDKFRLVGGPIATVYKYKKKTKAGVEDIIGEVEEIVREIDAKRVVLDPINLFLMLFDSEDERRMALATLSEHLTALGCTSLLVCEVKEQSIDISRYGFEEFVVDGVIALYSINQGQSFLQGVTVRKMRGIKHHREIRPYEITDSGIAVYPTQPWLPGGEE
ncbi:MAG: AAA family ATPase [Candidatus Altiarchaeales archaeon]|nr:AAA family ATPase [Candidatus Altiarchaeales archaeon]